MEIRYEGLLDNPGETMEKVCAFIGEPYSETVLKPNFIGTGVNLSQPGGYGTKSEILRTNQGKWRNEMSAPDRAIFESVAGDLLGELGYETEGHGRRIAMHERILWSIQDYYHFLEMRLKRRNINAWIADELLLRWADVRGDIKMEKLFGKLFPKRKG